MAEGAEYTERFAGRSNMSNAVVAPRLAEGKCAYMDTTMARSSQAAQPRFVTVFSTDMGGTDVASQV